MKDGGTALKARSKEKNGVSAKLVETREKKRFYSYFVKATQPDEWQAAPEPPKNFSRV